MNSKLSRKNINKVFENNCTSDEISLLFYFGKHQDADGIIKGIHYKTVATALSIGTTNFYKCIRSLENKNLIEIIETDKNWGIKENFRFTVKIIDNVYRESQDFKSDPYLNLKIAALNNKHFNHLKSNEKKIVIRILEISFNHHKKIILNFSTLISWTGVKIRAIKSYFKNLALIFNLFVDEENKQIIVVKDGSFYEEIIFEKEETAMYKAISYILENMKSNIIHDDISAITGIFYKKGLISVYQIKECVQACILKAGKLIPKLIHSFAKKISKK
jgi:hypothetical protein